MIPQIEKSSQEEIKVFQLEKLKETLQYLNKNSPFYKRFFKENDIQVSEIMNLEDLQKIPVTTKDHLQQFNDDFICVPKSEIIDYVTTSGTLGDPVTFALTDNDLERLAYNEAISFACCGVVKEDVLQLMTTMDRRFMAGLAYFLGARKLGAGIIRVGSGIPEFQVKQAIEYGHSKINVNTECQQVWTKAVREKLKADLNVYDPRKIIGPGKDAIVTLVKKDMQLFGSSNQA